MLVFIKYGDEQRMMINADCAVNNFLIYLRKQLKEKGEDLEDDDVIDLCDMNGILKGARNLAPMTSMSTVLYSRETYIPIVLETIPDDDVIVSFKLLLNPVENSKLYETLMARINPPKSSRQRRSVKSPKTRHLDGSGFQFSGERSPRASPRKGNKSNNTLNPGGSPSNTRNKSQSRLK